MSLTDIEQTEQQSLADQIVNGFEAAHLDETACRRYMLPLLRPVMTCPGCGVTYSPNDVERAMSGRDVICGDCGRKSAPRTGTVLEGVHAGYREIMLYATMRHWKIGTQEISRRTGLSDDTVRRLDKRFGGTGV